jgi:hypothetical protein
MATVLVIVRLVHDNGLRHRASPADFLHPKSCQAFIH